MEIQKRNLYPMNELPQWAYTDDEWYEIEMKTADVVNGVRMMYDIAMDNLEKEKMIVELVKKQEMIDNPSLSLIY